ncbi:PREDICTED: origin recognition complex subunit 1 isoform X2 [Atta colombica]|uniref:origin recognition complex subunit 1 isoform X2 n=1 Tax=Atta colombica TaxID=520822 RepID=UPI00084C72C4|nr:PREDICTED: origin recognition complex subunit 1 isoform X2 [Atta colombica]
MARFKKCTKKDISVLLETSSDSIVEESDKSYVPEKNTDNNSFDDLSDSDNIFENNKLFLLQTNALQKEQASLRLKLRRSTEQSMYKIDTESEDEKPKRLTRNTKRHLKSLHDENQISHARQNISFENTPKTSRIQKNIRKSILNISNQYESIHKDENKNKTDKVEVIHKVGKNLSIKTNQRNKAIDSLMVQNDLSTPKICILKQSTLKPSMKMRADILAKPVTPLQEIRTKLHVSTVPKSLPCREEEFNNIYTFLESKLMDNSGGSIYINGVPGTGKTATVNEIVKCLKRSVEKGKLNRFDFVEINGMKLSEPRQAYVQILKQLSGKVLTWEQAYNMLEKKFNSNAKRPMTLLLVDELDLLCTKRQDVIYNLLDWPTKASARLVVITIANTMDLPERVLMSRVTSRLGLTRVTFEPYNYKQLYEIILIRLKNTDIFENEIIQLIARKVSAVSGDARRALDICRRVAEITETRNNTTVTVQDVNQALSEMIINPKVQAIKHCSKFEQIFLQAVCVEVKRIGVEEVCFMNVYRQFESLCSFDGYKTPNITQTLDICAKLGDYRLLICECASNDIHKKILLNISKDELHYALQKIDFD